MTAVSNEIKWTNKAITTINIRIKHQKPVSWKAASIIHCLLHSQSPRCLLLSLQWTCMEYACKWKRDLNERIFCMHKFWFNSGAEYKTRVSLYYINICCVCLVRAYAHAYASVRARECVCVYVCQCARACACAWMCVSVWFIMHRYRYLYLRFLRTLTHCIIRHVHCDFNLLILFTHRLFQRTFVTRVNN